MNPLIPNNQKIPESTQPPKNSFGEWKALRPSFSGSKNKKLFLYTLYLGIVSGLAFSIALWGYEAILFITAHVAYPWITFMVGMILCVLICTAAALLTYLVNKAFLGIVFWVAAARLLAELAIFIPLKITPAVMMVFEPSLRTRLPAYPIINTLQTWAGIATIWLAIFFAILGLLQLTLVEQSTPATTSAGRLTPYFIFLPVMILTSIYSSNMINEQLREPLIKTDQLLQFAIEHQHVSVDPVVARQMHLATVDSISDLINQPRRLFLGKYDDYYGQVSVLIDFKGAWVECSTVYSEPVFCEMYANP